jgi:hypothetical protein
MYHSSRNTLRKLHREMRDADDSVDVVRGEKRRRLHKAFLRYHDANHWPLLHEARKAMGRADLIGNGKHYLIPTFQPLGDKTIPLDIGPMVKNSSHGDDVVRHW